MTSLGQRKKVNRGTEGSVGVKDKRTGADGYQEIAAEHAAASASVMSEMCDQAICAALQSDCSSPWLPIAANAPGIAIPNGVIS